MNNLSNNETEPGSRSQGHNIPALVFGSLLILLITAGNLLVCLSVYTEKPLRTTTNFFIVSLAASDLLLAVLVLPLFVYSEFQGGVWTLGPGPCDYLMTMDVMLCTASIFNLCSISVDRFIAVSIPLNYNRKHVDLRQIILLSMTWVAAFAVASPIVFGLNNVPGRDMTVCRLENQNYIIYSSICSFILPCPIMLLLYCGMFRGLKRWEEARKRKLRHNLHGFRKITSNPSEPQTSPPLIERSPVDVKLEELHLFPKSDCDLAKRCTDESVQTVTFSEVKYVQARPSNRRKRAKINGRERKAMKVLPIVVGPSTAPVPSGHEEQPEAEDSSEEPATTSEGAASAEVSAPSSSADTHTSVGRSGHSLVLSPGESQLTSEPQQIVETGTAVEIPSQRVQDSGSSAQLHVDRQPLGPSVTAEVMELHVPMQESLAGFVSRVAASVE